MEVVAGPLLASDFVDLFGLSVVERDDTDGVEVLVSGLICLRGVVLLLEDGAGSIRWRGCFKPALTW